MGVEIERKFLVEAAKVPPSARTGGAHFAQGYLSLEPTVRVRLAEREGEAPRAWLTVKGPGGLTRAEFEYAVPPEDARAMLGLCVAMLSKTRYRVPFGAHIWDLDHFHAPFPDLWLAEVELAHPDEPFTRPAWLGAEVTDDPQYSNAAIALAGHRVR
ncbi:MAG: CYTH domain-containing protein [Polyangiales bacterium]